MDITYRASRSKRGWVAEVWEDHNEMSDPDTLSEERYVEINEWCKESFGYHARTAYHIFEFKKRSHLDWFLIRWK